MAGGRVFQFGVFEASEQAGELRKHGVKIKLHAQPFQVLLLLLEKPAEVVTRKEMQQKLWGNHTFVDFEHGLNAAVNKIREALDDSAATPRFVETVPGKGYRFIAPVAVAGPAEIHLPEKPVQQQSFAEDTPTLPQAPRNVVTTLIVLVQLTYLAFYFGALGNLAEIHEIFIDADWLPPSLLMAVLVVTASVGIPVRLFLLAGIAFDFPQLWKKFRRLFPVLFVLDLLWAISPFLLVHHINTGIALGMTAALVYLPFAQRSLMIMRGNGRPLQQNRTES